MKKNLCLLFSFGALLLAGFMFPLQTQAGHYMGSELTYLSVAPNVYVVTLKYYRDCGGIDLGTAETLNIKSVGCSAGRNIPLNQSGGVVTGNPYCGTQTVSPCSGSAAPNYQVRTYMNTITFTPAEIACQNWILSTSNGSRPAIGNLVDADLANLYTEAYLRLSATSPNNSPEFYPYSVPIPYVCVNQNAVVSASASEPDGDSLSYELVRPLSAANSPIQYAINTSASSALPANSSQPVIEPTTGNCVIINNMVSPSCIGIYRSGPFDPRTNLPFQTAVLPPAYCGANPPGSGTNQPYSALMPIPVGGLSVDWVTNCATNIPATLGGFNLDSRTGVMKFKPVVYHPNPLPGEGKNRYAVVVQVNEWRKINGVFTKVGFIRRDMQVIVNDCQNQMPGNVISSPNPQAGCFPTDSIINVQACTTTRLLLKFTDTDPNDLVNVNFINQQIIPGIPGVPVIPGLVIKPFTNNLHTVMVEVFITPNASDAGKDYLLPVVVEDNHCPLKGRTEMIYRLHVNRSNRVNPVANNRDRTIALGQSELINVVLSRPDSIKQAPAIYNYHWTETNAAGGLPNGLNAADQNKKDITVTPTQTTRYFLTVTSSLAGCADTTSVLVRIGSDTGVKDLQQITSFSAYPNPFDKELHFKLNCLKSINGELIISNILGQQIDKIELKNLAAGEQNISWKNAANFPAGQYFGKLVSGNKNVQTVKFTKLQ